VRAPSVSSLLPSLSPRSLTALLFLVTACFIGLGIYGYVGSYPRGVSESGLGVAWIVAIGTLLIARQHVAFPLQTPLDQQQLQARRKSVVTHEQWFRYLEDANTHFFIAGHSLGRWCDESSHVRFTKELGRIIGGGGKVTLIMLHPDGPELPRVRAATGTDYSANVRRSLAVLDVFAATLSPEQRVRLKIAFLIDRYLPYMLVGNEHRLITATYLASRDSEEMPCLTLARESNASRAIYDDFSALAKLGAVTPAPLPLDPRSEQRRRLAREVLVNLKRLRSR
jgi:hypothetical protein